MDIYGFGFRYTGCSNKFKSHIGRPLDEVRNACTPPRHINYVVATLVTNVANSPIWLFRSITSYIRVALRYFLSLSKISLLPRPLWEDGTAFPSLGIQGYVKMSCINTVHIHIIGVVPR